MLLYKKIFVIILFFTSIPAGASNIAFDILALYLQPSFGGNGLGYSAYSNYAGADNSGVIVTNNGQNKISNIVPKWGVGIQLDGFYYYNTSNDINLTWHHLNEFVDGDLPPGSLFSGSVDGFYAGNLRNATKWDSINIEVGKSIYFDDTRILRLHTGMEFAWIKTRFSNHPKIFENSDAYFTSRDQLSYAGLGPRLGADFDFLVSRRFDFYLKTGSSLLWGSAKQNIIGYRDYFSGFYGLVPFGIPNYSFSNRDVIVPKLDAKLGFSYHCELAQGNLGINFGYLWMNYFGAITSYTGIGIVGSSIGIPNATNFNMNGYYLGVTWS